MEDIVLLNKGIQYAQDVIEGKEIANKYIVLTCKKFLEDYEKQDNDDFDYHISISKIRKIDNLLKIINFGKGLVVGSCIRNSMANFQAFMLLNIFGWRYKDNENHMRYRKLVLYIARKNAKTTLSALIFILLMLTEPANSEFYSICTSRELASEVKRHMTLIIQASPFLVKHFKISEAQVGIIKCLINNSFYKPQTSQSSKNNSINPSAFISDEHANFEDISNYNAMEGGQKLILNPLSIITTTGYELTGSIMIPELEYAKKVLDGEIEDENYFALLYYAEKGHEWDDIGMEQANPLRAEQVYSEVRRHRKVAKWQEHLVGEYMTKEMNIMLESNENDRYMSMEYWEKCRVDKVDFSGKEVIVGIDLSITTDLTSVSIMYKDEDGKIHCNSHGFLPSAKNSNRNEKVDYLTMAKNGYCTICNGATVDYTTVENYVRAIEETYGCTIKTIISDPFNAKQMMENLSEDYDVEYLKQTYTILSPPTKDFRKMVYDGNVFYEKNVLLDFCVGCATLHVGKSEDIMLNKRNNSNQRIDLLATLIFCYSELYVTEEDNVMTGEDIDNWFGNMNLE